MPGKRKQATGLITVEEARDLMSEKAFLAEVIRIAKESGWVVYHTHDSRRSQAGFPDLHLMRERVIYAELKSATGRIRRAQAAYLAHLARIGVEVYVWRPSDLGRVEEILARRATS